MSWLLSNPTKPYIDAAKTDVMRTWRKHGFIPPSETKGYHALENMQQVQQGQTSLPVQCPQRGKFGFCSYCKACNRVKVQNYRKRLREAKNAVQSV